jgi:hypothetical protein
VARYLLFRNAMKTPLKYIVPIVALTFALTLSAKATFVENTDFKGELKLFNDKDHKNVTDFTATVGGHFGPAVDIHTNGSVDSGAGFANITPNTGPLILLMFTPQDDTLFSDFSFRGQLTSAGTVTLTVVDSDGFSFSFTTPSEGKDDDIPRFGVISNDGETIKSVTLTVDSPESFKELKQVEFSFGAVQIPDGGATVMLLGAALSTLGLARRFFKK